MTDLNRRPLRTHRLAAAIVLACASTGLALADDNPELEELTRIKSFIEFGLGVVDEDARRFGRYNGLDEEGGYGVLNIDWYRRTAHDDPDPSYTRVSARNLGLDTRRLSVEHGRPGRYDLQISYAELPSNRSDTGSTIFRGAGTNALTLPGDWVPAQNTAGMTSLIGSLQPVELGHERRRFGLGLDALLARGWEISSKARSERKEGLKTFGAVIGNSGGNPRAVILPEPIDYEHREGEVALRYFDRSKQFEFRYLVSLFDENQNSLSWQNPFAAINGWNAAAGYPTGYGQAALPPDNQFHQFSAAGGYNWGNGLRLSGDVALGRMTQDEDFLPYTINPVLADSITQPLPRSSLDGRIDTTVANLRLTGRGNDKFSWGASWRFDDRDNRTPRDEYVYIGGDSNTQNVADNSSFRRFNEPASYRDSRLKLDLGYRFSNQTRLTGSLERRATERTYSEREDADESTLRLALRHSANEWIAASLRYEFADRDGSTYVGNEPFLSSYAPGYTSGVPGQFENAPLLRKLHLADRERNRFGANLTLMPVEAWTIALDAQLVDDDYLASSLGVSDTSSDVFTVDIGYTPESRWSAYAFYAHETLQMQQNGVSTRGGTRVEDAADLTRSWRAVHEDQIRTSGLGIKVALIEQRLDLSLDYLRASSETAIRVTTGSALSASALPDDFDRLRSLSLQAEYKLRDQWSLRLRLWNERYRSTSFTLDGVEANQLANVILLGEDSPDYDVNVGVVSLVYQF